MSLLHFKSILSIVILAVTLAAAWSMLEATGKQKKDLKRIEILKWIHRGSAIVYVAIYLFVAYFCLHFIVSARSELSPRANLHSLLALTIPLFVIMKIIFTRLYRQYHSLNRTLGIIITVITFNMVFSSGGYYLLATRGGTDKTFDTIYQMKMKGGKKRLEEGVKTGALKGRDARSDKANIERGKVLFNENCSICHDVKTTRTFVGPGLKGVLKNPTLPVSGRPATADNLRIQLRTPYKKMPSFSHLTDDDVEAIIAYLSTL